jgi:phage portal protein BeeE
MNFADELEKYLQNEKSGPKNAGKNLIIQGESGTKAEPYGFSLNDLDFVEGGRETARRIALAYGVPPQLIGIPGDSTYANYREARAALWEDTILYYLNYFKSELNNWMFGKDSDEFIDYNLENIPALAYKRDKLWERAQKSDFLMINEKREMVGLESAGAEGDVILVQASMVPLQMAGESPEDLEGKEEIEEEKLAKELRKQGYTDDEINSMLGFYGERQGE